MSIAVSCLMSGSDEKYRLRAKDFAARGLLRAVPELHVEIVTDTPLDLPDSWLQRVEPGSSPSQKRALHLAAWLNNPPDTEWFVLVDDDSVTDVAAMSGFLDGLHAGNARIVLYSQPASDAQSVNISILKEMGVGPPYRVLHEKECAVFSRGALLAFAANPQCIEFLMERARHPGGYGDHVLGTCAWLCGIYGLTLPRSSFGAPWIQMECFGKGNLFHVHAIARDRDAGEYSLFSRMCVSLGVEL